MFGTNFKMGIHIHSLIQSLKNMETILGCVEWKWFLTFAMNFQTYWLTSTIVNTNHSLASYNFWHMLSFTSFNLLSRIAIKSKSSLETGLYFLSFFSLPPPSARTLKNRYSFQNIFLRPLKDIKNNMLVNHWRR